MNKYEKEFLKALSSLWFHIVGGMLILSVGLIAEYYFSCNYFQRFGSILVAFALTLVFSRNYFEDELKGFYNLRKKTGQIPIERAAAAAKVKYGKAGEKIEEALKEVHALLSEEISEQVKTHENSVKYITATEVLLGICGTLVWGFGDLLIFKIGLIPLIRCPI